MATGISGVLLGAIDTVHDTIGSFLGGAAPTPNPVGLRPITLADATKLIQAGMTMQQLDALGYVITS